MCACHAQLTRGEGSRHGPAIADLRHEHDVILRALGIVERAGEQLAAGAAVDEAAFGELVELLRTFADRCHHGKEEHELFPVLRAKGVGSVLVPFLEDHVHGRDYLTALAGPKPAAARARAARGYVALLRDHIERENEVLFPMAEGVLTPDDHAELARRYEAVETRVVGPGVHEALLAALDRLEAAFPAPAPAAR
jgi:hemerythrin-like domain-containing protein